MATTLTELIKTAKTLFWACPDFMRGTNPVDENYVPCDITHISYTVVDKLIAAGHLDQVVVDMMQSNVHVTHEEVPDGPILNYLSVFVLNRVRDALQADEAIAARSAKRIDQARNLNVFAA